MIVDNVEVPDLESQVVDNVEDKQQVECVGKHSETELCSDPAEEGKEEGKVDSTRKN